MPWHDVGCSFTGTPAQDVSKHFIQRFNNESAEPDIRGNHPVHIEEKGYSVAPDSDGYNVTVQVLRSVDQWSAGLHHEASIHAAYLDAIKNSKHFIFIENQFFISSQEVRTGMPMIHLKVENQILSAIADRIVRAYEKKEDFHVIIVLPLKPEFPGKWKGKSGKDLRAVSYWNYMSIYSGEHSLYKRLENGKIPQDAIPRYLNVYGLRTHGTLNSKLVTEIIYVHSKMMVVDDRLAIIGSANINDRSMLGDRDSEVAVIIEDAEMIEGKMNGQSFQVGRFSHSLRCHLMREHLGLLDDKEYEASHIKIDDPLASTKLVSKVSISNNTIYKRVFGGRITPTNDVWNWKDLESYLKHPGLVDSDLNEAKSELDKLQGRIVSYPFMFLKDELNWQALDLWNIFTLPGNQEQTNTLNFDEPGLLVV